MIFHRARTYRLYPTPEQAVRLGQWVGAVRFVYNLALEQRRTFWRPGRRFDFVSQGREVTALRQEVEWLRDVPRNALDQALRDLDQAYRNWWGGSAQFPTPRALGRNDSIRLKGTDFRLRRVGRRAALVSLLKIGDVAARWDRPPIGDLRSITISRRAGQWYASILCAVEREDAEPTTLPTVGIDRGIAVFAALSTGEMIAGPNVGRKAATALAKAQRALARKQKGSNNRRKARLRVARLHARVSAARKDFLHKTSTALAKSHGVVVMEDLKVRNMTAAKSGVGRAAKAGLNRAILDQGWGAFRLMLAYKLEERGGYLLTVNPRDTSRTCAECGVVDADSREGIRFSCRSCGHEAHADTNAAINILRRGTPSAPVEVVSAAGEAGTTLELQQ
jgi:putative transposase